MILLRFAHACADERDGSERSCQVWKLRPCQRRIVQKQRWPFDIRANARCRQDPNVKSTPLARSWSILGSIVTHDTPTVAVAVLISVVVGPVIIAKGPADKMMAMREAVNSAVAKTRAASPQMADTETASSVPAAETAACMATANTTSETTAKTAAVATSTASTPAGGCFGQHHSASYSDCRNGNHHFLQHGLSPFQDAVMHPADGMLFTDELCLDSMHSD